MTRGTIAIITDNGYLTTNEYNGDMYISGYGKEVMKWLKKVKDKDTFLNENLKFCKEYYENTKIDVKEESKLYSEKGQVDFQGKTYYDKWFSDYVYIKNTTEQTQEIRDYDGKIHEIKPKEIQVYNFGDKMTKKQIKDELAT